MTGTGGGLATVPSLIGLTVHEARRLGHLSEVVVTSAGVDGPPLGELTWPGTWIVTAHRPERGARVARWSMVVIEFREVQSSGDG